MRARILLFAAVVAVALALNLARLSLSIGQTGEDTLRGRLAMSSTALKAQLDLIDARLAPRAVADVPDLVEATRAPSEASQPIPRPDERALRAAASALSPEPDLVAVATPVGAIASRRAKPAIFLEDPAQLPLAKAALEGNPVPGFAVFEGAVYRVGASRVPGNPAAAVVGTLVDDRFAQQLKSQVDADVTLVQGGKVIASSLQGEERARAAHWVVAPAPGYGVMRINLPLLGTALSGKLPCCEGQYAVRGVLVPIDGGVQAALTVPASPYFAWLGRYQAFYLAGLALFVLFSILWAALARTPKPIIQRVEVPVEDVPVVRVMPRTTPAPSLDVGEARAEPPPKGEVPWSRGSGELPMPQQAELDAEVSAPKPAEAHAMFDADTFMPTAGQITQEQPQALTAEEAGLVEASPEPGTDSGRSATNGDLGIGALDPAVAPEPSFESGAEAPAPPFPGDEPTRIEPVSAALLDKMRERDEEQATPAPAGEQGWGSLVQGSDSPERTQESLPPVMEPAAGPEANVTMKDFSLPALEDSDPDEAHWRETFDKFKELKAQLGEPADKISFEKFAAKLRKNRADLLVKHHCKGVRFSVYEKEGKAAIKASAIR